MRVSKSWQLKFLSDFIPLTQKEQFLFEVIIFSSLLKEPYKVF